MESQIHERPVFEKLLFAQSWEDPELDIEALQIRPGDRVVVVTSGGCNALSLLTTGPRELIAIDMNPVQSWIMELKLAGIRALSHQEFLTLLGVKFIEEPSPNHASAIALYARVRSLLSPEARSFWDRNPRMIQKGVLQAGRFELYLGSLRRLLKFIIGNGTLRDLMRQSLETQAEFYRSRWDRATWRLFVRIFTSRRVLGKRGLDPEFFKYANGVGSFGKHWLGLLRHALTDLPVRENYFLAQICFGRYLNSNAVPRYLQPRYFDLLKAYAGRVRILTDELEKLVSRSEPNSFDKFALSNIFEWVDEQTYEQLLQRVWRVATPGARLCYRNLLVRRERPVSFEGHLRSHREHARRLLCGDRSFLYSNFVIEEVIK